MAQADYTILTPERVSLEYGIAGIGSRGAAAIVDSLIQSVGLLVVFLGGVGALQAGVASRVPMTIMLVVVPLAGFIITSGYFILFETVWNGQTPGKRLVGLRVIRESGYPIRPVDAVIRNLVRLVDWLPFFYGVGVLVMLLNRRSKRLGDFASGTIVVRVSASRAPVAASGIGEPLPAVTLSNVDATLVRDFLLRRATLNDKARSDLAQRLAIALSHRYHLPLEPDSDAERFLEALSV
jgi:uncharacterized RDD family membrane protein YckC